MKRFAMIATILSAAAAGTAFAGDASAPVSSGIESPSALPADVAARVAVLRSYGDRFESAIRQIEQEALKPAWGWGPCGHEAGQVLASLPES